MASMPATIEVDVVIRSVTFAPGPRAALDVLRDREVVRVTVEELATALASVDQVDMTDRAARIYQGRAVDVLAVLRATTRTGCPVATLGVRVGDEPAPLLVCAQPVGHEGQHVTTDGTRFTAVAAMVERGATGEGQ